MVIARCSFLMYCDQSFDIFAGKSKCNVPKLLIFFYSFVPAFFLSVRPSLSSFVCVEVLRPSQPNGVMSSAVSLPNHTFTGQA